MSENSFLDLERLRANRNIKVRNHWEKSLKGLEWTTYFDFTRRHETPNSSGRGSYATIAPEQVEIALDKMAPSDKAKHIVLFGALATLIQKYTSLSDIAVFTPRYTTPHNTPAARNEALPIRLNEFLDLNFRGLLNRLKGEVIEHFKQENYPLQQMLDKSQEDLKHLPTVGMLLKEIQAMETFDPLAPELLFEFEKKNGLVLTILYDQQKYELSYIEHIAQKYFYLLGLLLENSEEKIAQIAFLTEEEKNQLLNEFNATEAYYPKEETIVSLFEKQVAQRPDQLAVTYGEKQFSYLQLKEAADKIGRYLREEKGVRAGDLVGVMLEREEYLIPVIFGILKAGGAYVPIDPNFPQERIQTIVDDSGMKVLFNRDQSEQGLSSDSVSILNLEEVLPEILAQAIRPFQVAFESTQLAYVIYTSGTTGKPKGAMIEHHSVINRILWMQKKYPIDASDVILQKTPIVFDVSVWELFWWSFAGASLVLLQPDGEKDPRELMRIVDKHAVTTLHFVPSMLGIFLSVLSKGTSENALKSIRQIFSSGEALKAELVHLFGKYLHGKRGARLINLYGPTEATVDVSYYECDFENIERNIPIGKPIDNIRLHILDASGNLLPIGVKGELHIAGVGLARGYLHREALTKEKFVHNFIPEELRLYKTGDLARWLPDGNIEFLGRLDHQVKIGGLRIELGDIENQLLKHSEIEEAVVLVKEKEKEPFLVSYYAAPKAVDLSALREFLAQLLPVYMIPTYFVHLKVIPLNGNGKVDRKALPEPKINVGKDYVAPASERERKLVEIWSKILKIDQTVIGIHSNFFELGGSSLKIIELNTIINEALNLELSVATLFRYKTISSLVDFIDHGDEKAEEYKDAAQKEVSGMHSGLSILTKITGG